MALLPWDAVSSPHQDFCAGSRECPLGWLPKVWPPHILIKKNFFFLSLALSNLNFLLISIKQNFKKLFKDKFNILYWIQSLKMGLDFLFLMLPAGVSYVKTAQEAQTRGVIWAFTGVTELSRMFFGKQ